MYDCLTEGKNYYVYAEYNPYWIYMGWWLYAIPTEDLIDGKQMEEWERATWLKYEWRLYPLFERLGLSKPDRIRKDVYCTEFMHKYPAGVVCQVIGDGRHWIVMESDKTGDYLRIVRERQLDHIAREQKEDEKQEVK